MLWQASWQGAACLEVGHLLLQHAQLTLQASRLRPQACSLLNRLVQPLLRCCRLLGGGISGLLQRVALQLQFQARKLRGG